MHGQQNLPSKKEEYKTHQMESQPMIASDCAPGLKMKQIYQTDAEKLRRFCRPGVTRACAVRTTDGGGGVPSISDLILHYLL